MAWRNRNVRAMAFFLSLFWPFLKVFQQMNLRHAVALLFVGVDFLNSLTTSVIHGLVKVARYFLSSSRPSPVAAQISSSGRPSL